MSEWEYYYPLYSALDTPSAMKMLSIVKVASNLIWDKLVTNIVQLTGIELNQILVIHFGPVHTGYPNCVRNCD